MLLTPNERLTIGFRYVIQEIFVNLPLAAKQNIMFCFTHSRETDFRPGDTYVCLQLMLEQMRNTIQLNSNNTFCFESDSFRFLCAQKCALTYNSSEKEYLQRSFFFSKRELFRLIDVVSRTEPYKIGETRLLVDNIRGLIMNLIRPMAVISKSIVSSNGVKEEQIRELEEDEARVNEIRRNRNSRSELESAANRMRSARELIANLEAKINDLKERRQAILVFRTEAIVFMRRNMFLTVNDALVDMFDQIINEERDREGSERNNALITELTGYRDQYQEYEQWIKQHVEDGTHRVKTTAEMRQLIEEMRSRPRIGTLFTNVEEPEAMQGRKEAEDAATVDLTLGWLGWVFFKMMKRYWKNSGNNRLN